MINSNVDSAAYEISFLTCKFYCSAWNKFPFHVSADSFSFQIEEAPNKMIFNQFIDKLTATLGFI